MFEEKSNTETKLRPELEKPYKELLTQAKLIAKISIESKLPIVEEEYCQKFKNQLMEVVYTWTEGASFATICKMTDVYEGSLIRMFRRLEELLRQMIMAAKAMGSEELEKRFEDAMGKVRRGVTPHFTSSKISTSLTPQFSRHRQFWFALPINLAAPLNPCCLAYTRPVFSSLLFRSFSASSSSQKLSGLVLFHSSSPVILRIFNV